MKILLISILGHHKIGLDLGVISMHSRFFYLRSRYRIRVAKISKIFFEGGRVAWYSWYLWGRTVYASSKPTYEEKWEYHLWEAQISQFLLGTRTEKFA